MAARKKLPKKSVKAAEVRSERKPAGKVAAKTSRKPAAKAVKAVKAAPKPEKAAAKTAAAEVKASAPAKKAVAPAPEPTKRNEAKPEIKNGEKSKVVSKTQDIGAKVVESKDNERRNSKGARPATEPSESAPAAVLTTATAKPPVETKAPEPAPRPVVATAASPVAAKAAKPSATAKPIDRDPAGGEQKTMKNNANRHGFKLNEFVVYPAHGVGQIVAMEEQEVAGFKLELFVINFVKDKMTLRVPTSKVTGVGMRKLSDPEQARRSLEILTGRARIKRTMWSRRAQEYEAKINSGDINAIAEVVRDLYRSEAQPEQSYSERQLYEAALDRMMREIAAVQKLSETEALKVIEAQLKKNAKRGAKGEGEAEEGIEEAA